MKVLLTGAFGNLGLLCLERLLADGHELRCTDLEGEEQRKQAARFSGQCEIVFGNICEPQFLPGLVEGVEAIVHLASLLPPNTDKQPALAEAVNVDAAKALIDCAARQTARHCLFFPHHSPCSVRPNGTIPHAAVTTRWKPQTTTPGTNCWWKTTCNAARFPGSLCVWACRSMPAPRKLSARCCANCWPYTPTRPWNTSIPKTSPALFPMRLTRRKPGTRSCCWAGARAARLLITRL
ncbi:MAG: NAD-dependent epimerase/dehydratase family protein [Spongiibacter sp.]|nr:NAD-dependent epimerase/dehydratase family protein [Spongiibacter sp.]